MDHKEHLPELHAFLKRYGHKDAHADEHVLKAVANTPTLNAAKRALGQHPAFFNGPKAVPVQPGQHRFTGKAIVKQTLNHEQAAAKAAAPSVHGASAAQKHRDSAKKLEATNERIPGRTNDERKMIQVNATSAAAHMKSANAAKSTSPSAHEGAAIHHELAARNQMAHGISGQAVRHKEIAEAHKAAAGAIRGARAKAAEAPKKAVPKLAEASKGKIVGTIKPAGEHKASGWAAWRASFKKAS
jgi:hypothetical protein